MEKLLIINPGSTSTKIAVFDGENKLWGENIEHGPEELARYEKVFDQLAMRTETIYDALQRHGDDILSLSAVVSRGGTIVMFKSGAYEITQELVTLAETDPLDQHASIVGPPIAYSIAQKAGVKAYLYDAVSIDEMSDMLKMTGLPFMERLGKGHNLNMRAAAIKHCEQHHCAYQESRLIIAHLGGGISVSLHDHGKIADLISDDEGAFSPERAGGVPCFQLVKYCFQSGLSEVDIMKKLQRQGGLMAHLGTADARVVEERIAAGDPQAKLVYEAMAMSVAKNIGKISVVTSGEVDGIILTGGIAHSKMLTEAIANRVSFIAPVYVYPGEDEMKALALGGLRVLRGQETAKIYSSSIGQENQK